jgi:hypothetical protein
MFQVKPTRPISRVNLPADFVIVAGQSIFNTKIDDTIAGNAFPSAVARLLTSGGTFMRWLFLFAISWPLALAGCASSGVVKNASPVATMRPVSLDFILVGTSSALPDTQTDGRLLNDKLIAGLRDAQLFGTVTGNKEDVNAGSGMKVTADILEIKRVSPDARTWLGALAGQARVLVRVTVSDLNSGDQIQAFDVEGKSGASATAGTTDEAMQLVAQQVVAEIIRISRQTSQ